MVGRNWCKSVYGPIGTGETNSLWKVIVSEEQPSSSATIFLGMAGEAWQRLYIDFAGPLKGKMYFMLVEAHSKWPEVVEMQSTTAEKTIQVMREMFATYGLPEQVVSDNGSQFTSQEFAEFMKRNGIKHIKSTPYHPSTNGLAERFVQTFKRAMLKDFGSRPTHHQLANFLLVY